MKIVIPGGTGQVGKALERALVPLGHQVVIIGRNPRDSKVVPWDGRSLGEWARQLDGADVVINLAGRNVNCRYTNENRAAMLNSRVDSARAVGLAICQAKRPPALWLQMSTATIYAHRFDAANDEATGRIGGHEPDVPSYWSFSVDIAKAWERAQLEAEVPDTRRVALRAAIVLTPDAGGIFDTLLGLTRWGLGGTVASGEQFVSWIHERDFVRAVLFLIERRDLEGAINIAAPNPLPQREFMRALRAAWQTRIGLPATKWMIEVGAFFLRTDSELLFKSRRVVPRRLLEAGFAFEFPEWPAAARELVERWRALR